jgi:PA14 domain/Bacterial Ig domain
LALLNPTAAAHGTNFSVVVSNDSGSVTSRVAVLSIVQTNQAPVPLALSFVAFQGQAFTIPLSDIVQESVDPDHDPILFSYADVSSTNGAANGLANVQQLGAALVYTPVAGYLGADQFTYTITDQIDNSVGTVDIIVLTQPQPTNQVVAPGGSASFDVGVASAPPGYGFQWQLNGTNIAGATAGRLSVANAQLANAGSYTLVVTDPHGQHFSSPIAGLTVGILGTGTGLTGDYYGFANGTTNFSGLPTLTQVDPTIDFNWGTGAPDPSLPADGFQVRWHGWVQPFYSDVYTFSTTTDDGARLWVNGQMLVNRWQNQAATTASGTISLQANQKYDILMEYYENTSFASAQLSWTSLHQPPQVIPMTQLYPSAGLVHPSLAANLLAPGSLQLNWPGTFTLQSAPAVTGPWSTVAIAAVAPYFVSTGAGAQVYYRLVDPIAP